MPSAATKDLNAKLFRISRAIACDLFTSGAAKNGKADNLRLFQGERYLGGWGEKPMADRIFWHLRRKIK